MVKIADVLAQRRLESSPCVAHVSQTQPTRVLSYRNAWKSLKEHEKWLNDVLLLSEEPNSTDDDVVLAYLSSNSTDMMISMLASASSTSVAVALLNTRWTPSEMAAVLQTSPSRSNRTILLYSAEFREKALETQSILQHATQLLELPLLSTKYLNIYKSDGSREIMTASDEEIDAQIRTSAGMDSNNQDDDALLVFTSGTTSGSKGVRLSHAALWIQALAKLQSPCRYSSSTHMLANTVPLFHVGGLSSTLALWLAGGTWMIPTGKTAKGFGPATVLKLVSHPVVPTNTLVVVPAMLHSLLQQVDQSRSSTYPAVELILIGGQSASHDMLTRLRRIFPNARLVQTYACTEAASSMTFHEPTTSNNQALPIAGDCVGIPPPHVQLQLVQRNEETGQETIVKEPYQVGILATRGPHVMNGYWKRGASLTAATTNKWFLTNDLGFRDDFGCYYFCGRGKDVIRTGGETVIALEVERVLLQQSSGRISECAVFALPDDRFGEAVCAAIVMKAHQPPLSLQDIRNRYCQSLAGYKRPRRVFLVDALPRNSSGKVLKYKLADQFTAPTRSKL